MEALRQGLSEEVSTEKNQRRNQKEALQCDRMDVQDSEYDFLFKVNIADSIDGENWESCLTLCMCGCVHLKISVTSDFLWKVNVIFGASYVSLVIDTNERALICYATDRRLFLQNSRRGNVILAHLLTKESLVLHSCFSALIWLFFSGNLVSGAFFHFFTF